MMDTSHYHPTSTVQVLSGYSRSDMMVDERKPEDELKDQINEVKVEKDELDENELDNVVGGAGPTRHDTHELESVSFTFQKID
jgi:bacteriocin-like protein